MFSYTLYLNPSHDLIDFKIPKYFRDVTFMMVESQIFHTYEEARNSLEDLITKKRDSLKAKQEIFVVREQNPKYILSDVEFEEALKDNPDFDGYMSTWDENGFSRITVTTEELELSEDDELMDLPHNEALFLMRGVIEYIAEAEDVKHYHLAPNTIQ